MQGSTEEEEKRSLLSEESPASNGECSDDAITSPQRRRGEIEETLVDDHGSSLGRGDKEDEEGGPARLEGSREGTEPPAASGPRYRLYRRRWFMLASLCLLSISNGTVREEERERDQTFAHDLFH